MRYVMNALAPNSPLYPQCPHQRALVDRALDYDLGTLNPLVAACTVSTGQAITVTPVAAFTNMD